MRRSPRGKGESCTEVPLLSLTVSPVSLPIMQGETTLQTIFAEGGQAGALATVSGLTGMYQWSACTCLVVRDLASRRSGVDNDRAELRRQSDESSASTSSSTRRCCSCPDHSHSQSSPYSNDLHGQTAPHCFHGRQRQILDQNRPHLRHRPFPCTNYCIRPRRNA